MEAASGQGLMSNPGLRTANYGFSFLTKAALFQSHIRAKLIGKPAELVLLLTPLRGSG
jgi:hypothetical protein